MTIDELSGEPAAIWPDNLAAVNLFIGLGTQWRVGAAGAVGLDYNVLYRKLDRLNLSVAEYDALEDDVRVMEEEALNTMQQSQEAAT